MSEPLQLWLLLGSAVYLAVIFFMLKTRKLTVKYALVWLISGFVLVVFAAVPYVVYVLRDLLSVEMPSNLVFAMVIGFMLLILLSLSAAVTSFAERIRRLTQTVAILEERIRRLEGESTPPCRKE